LEKVIVAILGLSLTLLAADPPFVRPSFTSKDASGKTSTWRYPAIRVKSAANAVDADIQLMRAQGYEHARLRYFPEMEFFRRLVTGRISGLIPDAGAREQDKKFLAIGLHETVRKTTENIRRHFPAEYRFLEAYAEGVNSYLVSRWVSAGTDKWEPQDSVAISIAFSFLQSASFEDQLFIGSLQRKLYETPARPLPSNFPKAFIDFLDFRPIFAPNVPPQTLAQAGAASPTLLPSYTCPEKALVGGCKGNAPGSNAFVLSASRLKSNLGAASALTSDPHMPLMNPSLFFWNALDSKSAGGTFFARGASVPGVPGIVIGENRDIAWGINNAMPHSDQVYVEQLSADGKQVLFNNQWIDLEIRTIEMPGMGEKKETLVVRTVPHHGPIFSDHWPGISGLAPQTALSWKWSCAEESLEFVGILAVNRAQNWDEFKEGLRKFCGVGGNFTFADQKGNIGFYQHGKYPKRPWASKTKLPYVPVAGTGTHEWEGYFDRFLEIYNPASGFIAVSNDDLTGKNQKPHLSDFENYYSFRQLEGARSQRMTDRIEAFGGPLDWDDIQSVQNDHYDKVAERMVKTLVAAANDQGEVAASPVGKALLGFDFQMKAESRDALVYSQWLSAIMADTLAGLIPEDLYSTFTLQTYTIQTLYWTLVREKENDFAAFKQRILRTLETTQTHLIASGNAGKTWGDIHRLKMESPLDALFSTLGMSLTPTDIPRDGNFWTVDVGAYIAKPPADGSIPVSYPNNYGPIFRMTSMFLQDGTIDSRAILARGIASPLDSDGKASVNELRMYSKGQYGPLVPYIR
jgi:penicillin G amidase